MVSPASPTVLPSVSGSLVSSKRESDLGVTSERRLSRDILSVDAEDEDRLHPGLRMIDKVTLGAIWGFSFLYSVLTEQVLSKKVDLPCNISHDLEDKFQLASAYLAILVPFILGPVLITIIHCIISVANVVLQVSPVSEEIRRQEKSHVICILSLTAVFLFTYILSMIVSEVYVDLSNVFYFVLVKYIAGIYGLRISRYISLSRY